MGAAAARNRSVDLRVGGRYRVGQQRCRLVGRPGASLRAAPPRSPAVLELAEHRSFMTGGAATPTSRNRSTGCPWVTSGTGLRWSAGRAVPADCDRRRPISYDRSLAGELDSLHQRRRCHQMGVSRDLAYVMRTGEFNAGSEIGA